MRRPTEQELKLLNLTERVCFEIADAVNRRPVLKRAANQPMGYVASAVMLNAKLKKGVNLLHVMALTRSIGLLQTEKEAQPEVYRWQDNGGSHVTCTFMDGKLQSWALYRPHPDAAAQEAAAPTSTPEPSQTAQ